MKLLAARSRNELTLLGALVLAAVGFGTWYRLTSMADQEAGAVVQVVDSRSDVRAAVQTACEHSGDGVAGEVNDVQVDGQFAQATAVCRKVGSENMQPTFFTFKLTGGTWKLLAQGPEPPSAAKLPDPQLPAKFASSD
jgi:hypothetical protein